MIFFNGYKTISKLKTVDNKSNQYNMPEVFPKEKIQGIIANIMMDRPMFFANWVLDCIHFSRVKVCCNTTFVEVLYKTKLPKKINNILNVIMLLAFNKNQTTLSYKNS